MNFMTKQKNEVEKIKINNLEKLTKEELIAISKKRVKSTGLYTRKAKQAQAILYHDENSFADCDKMIYIKDNGIIDRDFNDVFYNGYDEEEQKEKEWQKWLN